MSQQLDLLPLLYPSTSPKKEFHRGTCTLHGTTWVSKEPGWGCKPCNARKAEPLKYFLLDLGTSLFGKHQQQRPSKYNDGGLLLAATDTLREILERPWRWYYRLVCNYKTARGSDSECPLNTTCCCHCPNATERWCDVGSLTPIEKEIMEFLAECVCDIQDIRTKWREKR
jgi:hypothetical protein